MPKKNALTYEEQIEKALKKQRRKGCEEGVRYYTEYVRNTSACTSYETFKGSWAHQQWIKTLSK